MQTRKLNHVNIRTLIFTFISVWFSSSFINVCFSELNQSLINHFKGKIIKVSSKWKRVFFMSLSCHKINYSSVPNKWNKRPHIFFSKKYLKLPYPFPALIRTPPTRARAHTHTDTNSHTHHLLIFHFFSRKNQKNEVQMFK